MRDLAAASGLPRHAAAGVTWHAPIPRPRKNVFCVGWNYLEHFKEGEINRPADTKYPDHPVFFSKAPPAVNGPFDPVPYDPAITKTLDWEVELGAIIGKTGKTASALRVLLRAAAAKEGKRAVLDIVG